MSDNYRKADDGYCPSCARRRPFYGYRDDESHEWLTCCTVCSRIVKREPITENRPENAKSSGVEILRSPPT